MDYQFKVIEEKWQKFWAENQTYRVSNTSEKPKYYVLDMFPYPSGAGLHVGHPLGYIATDIYARYKRLKGFNVLHPMGYDSFGLPAEQYAIQTGQHPAITTQENIKRYRKQLDKIGFSFDWSREVRTSNPDYYKWTQWIFMQLYDSWYNKENDRAEGVDQLLRLFESNGTYDVNAVCDEDARAFSAAEWEGFSEQEKQTELLKYRLAYLKESYVNWCPELGTVLANDEVKDGVSERGGFPVERKKMMQWSMRITAYAERLLNGLTQIDWPEPLVEMQKNWIGKSVGAVVRFDVDGKQAPLEVFTTRLDTIYGVTFMVIAPEHERILELTTGDQMDAVLKYIDQAKQKTELERMAETKVISGVFTGAYAIHPLTGDQVPVWTSDYVLAGYGTGAVMAVPSGDQRDYDFAKHFNLPIVAVLDKQNIEDAADPGKEGRYINSGIINGLSYEEAMPLLLERLEGENKGWAKVNYRMRDAVFGRQRYWGEPVPIYFKDDLTYLLDASELPLRLPEVDQYLPTSTGEPPLGRAQDWKYQGKYSYELSTMPGWAGSSWYWYRYMDPQNGDSFASPEAIAYWKSVDLYIGGSEHATGHLLYSRFWNKFLKDRGWALEEEPFKKLINQGMIQGRSNFVYRVVDKENDQGPVFVSKGLKDQYKTSAIHVDVRLVVNDVLNIEGFKQWRPEYTNAKFILEDGKYICGYEVEKMSKSRYNVINPDEIIEQFGADTLRMYEMFLGPLEQSKPWNTNGIEGVFKFLRKFWRLFHNDEMVFEVSDQAPSPEELKSLHKIIKKVQEDIERFSFNTSISAFMICVNELSDLKCNNRQVLQDLCIVLAPYAPHITEELWTLLGNEAGSLSYASYPKFHPEYLIEQNFDYPISFNGKTRLNITLPMDLDAKGVEAEVLANAQVQGLIGDKTVRRVIVVLGRIVNIVL